MKSLKVTIETITPLFLGGANPKGEPELRAPSFRGVMRFWLRALLGGVLGDNPREIFKRESEVFGSTEHASPVAVRANHPRFQTVNYSQLTANKPGLAYLLFSARGTRSEPERVAIRTGQIFELTCQFMSGAQSNLTFDATYASLWLLTHLGGIGSRSRRGGGNLQVRLVQGDVPSYLPSLQVQARTPRELQNELAQGLSRLRRWAARAFNGSLSPSFSTQPEFDVLHPNFCEIWVVNKTFNSWGEALNEFGLAMQQFRQRHQPDYQNVKSVIQKGGNLQPVRRAAFGLPIVFYYRSLGASVVSVVLEGTGHDRRTSPLIVRVVKLADGKCALVLIHFIALLLPANEQLRLRRGKQEIAKTQQPDDAILSDFINHLQNRLGSLLGVSGW